MKKIIVVIMLFLLGVCSVFAAPEDDEETLVAKALAGDAEAQYECAVIIAVDLKDYPLAFKWHLKAAEQGYIDAQFSVGLMYGGGIGVEQNYIKSVEWLSKAAEHAHFEALYYLAMHYEFGEGVEQNPTKAIELYQRAAAQNHHQSQGILGLHYRDGFGVERDLAQAYMWTKMALANAGDDTAFINDAIVNLADIESQISPADLARGKKLLAERGYNDD